MTDLNELNLPKQEVTEEEYREHLINLAVELAMPGQKCRYCNKGFRRPYYNVVFAGRDEPSYAHGRCWRWHSRKEAGQKD